ncbi:cytochrome c554 [Salmonella enterica subsp. enterica serovar Choleraesuis]|nr:cytochrome c554 [Salmonella enterica subsp. enterica serovar Choleraesuis]
MLKRVVAIFALCCWWLPAQAAGDAKAGEQKAVMCVACHGMEGKSTSPLYPSLAGQSAEYLAGAMHAYKKGERSGGQAGIMQAYVAGLSESDINNLAAYYASQKAGK